MEGHAVFHTRRYVEIIQLHCAVEGVEVAAGMLGHGHLEAELVVRACMYQATRCLHQTTTATTRMVSARMLTEREDAAVVVLNKIVNAAKPLACIRQHPKFIQPCLALLPLLRKYDTVQLTSIGLVIRFGQALHCGTTARNHRNQLLKQVVPGHPEGRRRNSLGQSFFEVHTSWQWMSPTYPVTPSGAALSARAVVRIV